MKFSETSQSISSEKKEAKVMLNVKIEDQQLKMCRRCGYFAMEGGWNSFRRLNFLENYLFLCEGAEIVLK